MSAFRRRMPAGAERKRTMHWLLGWRWFVVTSVLAAGLLSGCAPRAPQPATAFTLELTEFTVTPGLISAQVGDRLSFRVSNRGVLEHNVSIQDPGGTEVALLSLLPSQHGTLQVEPTTPGAWRIICTLSGHEMAGMAADLTVGP
jgi:plastocyanin